MPQSISKPQTFAKTYLMSKTTTGNNTDEERLQCMEVWGGNRATDRCFRLPGMSICLYSHPYGHDSSGGDVYYLSSCAAGRLTRLLLADVSGHGATVSGIATGLRDLMRKNINRIRQTRFVQNMNQQFSKLAEGGGFATAVVGSYFAPTRSLSLCNAGHPPPMIFRQQTQSWQTIDHTLTPSKQITDTPLGVLEAAEYREFTLPLQTGDMVLCYSDAIIESETPAGPMLGTTGLLKLLADLDDPRPANLIARLLERIQSLSPANNFQDDTTMMLCWATDQRASTKNNLLAPFRMLGTVSDNTGWYATRQERSDAVAE
ncbi:MAG: hypothetical protein CMJ75_10490 [Planctomycetaceae bacterium]|nr:hypothetical protein [Planctomycetaceae bacterium]